MNPLLFGADFYGFQKIRPAATYKYHYITMKYMIDRKLFEIVSNALGTSYVKQYPDNFDTRIIVQKTLYLLTHGSSNPQTELSYKWNFYLHGPYSPEISHMIYHMNEVWDDIPNKHVDLEEKDLKSIEHFKRLKKELEEKLKHDLQQVKEAELFEIVATLIYLAEQLNNDREKVQEKFREFKPKLDDKISRATFQQIYSMLQKYSYV
ncbi:MAG: hypothetical protein R6U96_01830 [Promethearchaeia archaeon]